MERRKFLTAAVGSGAALLGGAGFLFLRPTKEVTLPPEGLQYFNPREYAIFVALGEAMVVVPKGVPDANDVRVAFKADRYMQMNTPDAQKDFHQLLGLFDNALAGFLLCGASKPFTQMNAEDRTAFLHKWENHSIALLRSGFIALKKLVMSCYYASPEAWPSLSYPGPMEAA